MESRDLDELLELCNFKDNKISDDIFDKLNDEETNELLKYLEEKGIEIQCQDNINEVNNIVLTDNQFNDYINQLSSYKVLSKEEQNELFQEKNDEAREKIFFGNWRMVISIVNKKYRSIYNIPVMDLIQAGNEGLLKSIDLFNPNRGVEFSTYAYKGIVGSIRNYLKTNENDLKVPPQYHKIFNELEEKYSSTTGSLPSIDEIVKQTGLEKEKVIGILAARNPRTSLFAPVIFNKQDNTTKELIDTIIDYDHLEEAEKNAINNNIRQILLDAMNERLTEKERETIKLQFGFDSGYPKSISEVAKELNIARQSCAIRSQKACFKLRYYFNSTKQFQEERPHYR